MKRRNLLQLGTGLSAFTLLGTLLRARSSTGPASNKVFVLVELRGGNDGLNTLIPYADTAYLQARPRLALGDGPRLDSSLMLHPALAPLLPSWRERRLAFALGVGWPTPNRSHFKAQDQWSTGRPDGEGSGWLGRAYASSHRGAHLVALGPTGSTALEGADVPCLQMSPAQLRRQSRTSLDPAQAGDNQTLRRILAIEQAGAREFESLRLALRPLPKGLKLPPGSLGQQVGLALRLIASGQPPPVLAMSQSGFDTHQNQLVRHARGLSSLAAALAAFDAGLRRIRSRPQVTLLVTSEFGRRLRENGSGGTDHGSASIAMLMGDHVPHPFVGHLPSLAQLDERGDLIPSISPPTLYQQALRL